MQILWTEEAWEDYCYWQTNDRRLQKKINELIKDILRNPYSGVGKPEPLKHNLNKWWSRRIDGYHRLVYQIADNQLIILSCNGHYND